MFRIMRSRSWLGIAASFLVAVVIQFGLAGPGRAHGEALRLEPAEAGPGQPLAIHGTGFEPGTSVSIVMEGVSGDTSLATATPDSEGEFTVDTSVPMGMAAGTYRVVAKQAGESVGADFTVMESMPMGSKATDMRGEAASAAEAGVVYQRSPEETIAIGIIVAILIAAGAYLVLAGTERRPRLQH